MSIPPVGHVSRTTDGNGNSVRYRYNSFGKVSERTDQLGYTETFEYDEEGNLALHIDRDGRRFRRECNVFGKPVYEKTTDAEGNNPNISTWQYDSLGRVTRAVRDGHSYEYIYDEYGNLKEKRSNGKRLISYTHDRAGQVTEKSGYDAQKAKVLEEIKDIYHSHNGVDGYRSMRAYLKRRGYSYSAVTIHKYMNTELGLRSIVRPRKPGAKPGNPHKVFENRLNHEDGVDCFVHFSNINMEGFKRLKAEQTVSFVQDEDEQGRTVAKEVTIITEGEEE